MTGPHAGRPVLTVGAPLPEAAGALVLVHGRGGSAEDMLGLAEHLDAARCAVFAPSAAGSTWYPYSFMSPVERNQPHLDSALALLDGVVETVRQGGVPLERLMMVGFSQGGCLAVHYCHTRPARYGGAAALSGGLIGPPDTDFGDHGSLDGTPVFLGCSDQDPHIPETRVHETAAALRAQDARVDTRIYPGMGHTVNRDELDALQTLIGDMLDGA